MEEVSSIQVKREREKARELRKSRWWQNLIQKTRCYYCQKELEAKNVSHGPHRAPVPGWALDAWQRRAGMQAMQYSEARHDRRGAD